METEREIEDIVKMAVRNCFEQFESFKGGAPEEDGYRHSRGAAELFSCSYEKIRVFKSQGLFLPGKIYRVKHLHAWHAATVRFGITVSKGKVEGDGVEDFRDWLADFCEAEELAAKKED